MDSVLFLLCDHPGEVQCLGLWFSCNTWNHQNDTAVKRHFKHVHSILDVDTDESGFQFQFIPTKPSGEREGFGLGKLDNYPRL